MSDLKSKDESLESLLSTAIGLLMGHKDRIGYKPGSVIAKFVDECVERLKDWPYTTAAQPAQAGQVPELTSTEVNDACWAFVETMPHQLPGAIFNDLKPAIHAAICEYIERAGLARVARVPQWLPIETAPVSGRGERPNWFLAANGHHVGVCARWGDEGYGETIADECDQVVSPSPTHWMPLPPPPGIVGEKGGAT